MRRAFFALVASVGLVAATVFAVAAPPASASPAWSPSPTPSPPGLQSGGLTAVACPSATRCFAVGNAGIISSPALLAQRWNGSRWSAIAMPTRAGVQYAQLAGITCRSSTNCFAVGDTSQITGSSTLIEHWNGTKWSVVASPNKAGAKYSSLSGVACPSATRCFAVGQYFRGDGGGTLIERWNGKSWSIVASPNRPGGTPLYVNGVACTSGSSCLAVGSSGTKSYGTKTLVERWNGKAWSILPSLNPNGGSASFRSVACSSAKRCFAVGSAWNGSNDFATKTLVEQWNGTSWSRVASPRAGGLSSVSCGSSTSCLALGGTFVQRWNGTVWSNGPGPEAGGNAVSCPGPNNCFAVGEASSNDMTTISRWNGAQWSTALPPLGSSQSRLGAVACTSPSSCLATGSNFDGSADIALAEQWNGSSWSTAASPVLPSGAIGSNLSDLACAASTNCVAVGSSYAILGYPLNTIALAEQWNGSSWSLLATPLPAGTTSSSLNGVSCPNATSCIAVGTYTTASATNTLIEQWDGTSWSIVASPNPGSTNTLNGVSCTSTTDCVAVGRYFSPGTKTLVEQWNGSSWSTVASPNASGGSVLYGVSCTSSTNCFAVGTSLVPSQLDYQPTVTLVEQWNGSSWSIGASPGGAGLENDLDRVACPSTTMCVAVGDSFESGPLIQQWNGTSWTTASAPKPAGSTGVAFNGVSCPSTTSCFAAGSNSTPASNFTLIERYA